MVNKLKKWEEYMLDHTHHDRIFSDLIEYSFELKKQIRILNASILITSISIIILTLTK